MSNNPTITRWLNGAAASRKRYGEQVNQDLKDNYKKAQEHSAHLIEKEKVLEYELSKNFTIPDSIDSQ